MSLYNKYRPATLEEMVGVGKEFLETIQRENPPHSYLLFGEPGAGKTTLARCMAYYFGATDMDLIEINASDFNGVDSIRELVSNITISPFGKAKVYVLDEAQRITTEGQNALLKALEEPPRNVYFILCTTEPTKLTKAVRSRCTPYEVKGLTEKEIYAIIRSIRNKEENEVSPDVLLKIADKAQGNPREAINILESVLGIEEEERQLKVIRNRANESEDKYTIDLCRALYSREVVWSDIMSILASLKEQKEDPERIRRAILGYGQAILLKTWNDTAIRIMFLFEDNFFDTGFPGLIMACARACNLADVRF